jgi:hypothetical protein
MKHIDIMGILPPQRIGKEIEDEVSIDMPNEREAIHLFESAKVRLKDVNNWHHVAGLISARFQLIDKKGCEVSRPVQQGDFFKIDIPGPGSKEGDGYDWAQVEEIREINRPSLQGVGFRVRPIIPLAIKTKQLIFMLRNQPVIL